MRFRASLGSLEFGHCGHGGPAYLFPTDWEAPKRCQIWYFSVSESPTWEPGQGRPW